MILPSLKWVSSPNVSDRAAPVSLIVLHDCQGSYAGSVSWFANPASQVSAHFVLKEDGSEATQMVSLDKKAWHCCDFNSQSIGVEMGGFAERGFPDAEWIAAAQIVAYLLHRYNLPVRWAHGGSGPGFCSHFDLGKRGGGHSDPTTDAHIWQAFVARVQAASNSGVFPSTWARGEPGNAAAPSTSGPAQQTHAPIAQSQNAPHDVRWLQRALNTLGADPALIVDGNLGPHTQAALRPWQFGQHIPTTGQLDAATIAAITKALPAIG